MYVYIVSLTTDTERRNLISKKLTTHGVDFEFVDAIYGRSLSSVFLDRLNIISAQTRLNRMLTPGEIGCTLSHLKAYEKLIEDNREWACILEDDAILSDAFPDFIKNVEVSSLEKFKNTVFVLGGQDGLLSARYISTSYFNKVLIAGEVFRKVIGTEKYVYRTCCYVINNKVAASLINLSKNEFFVADDWYYFYRLGIVRSYFLSNFVHHPEDYSLSHLQKEREESFSSRKNESKKDSIFHKFYRRVFSFFKHRLKLFRAFLFRFLF